MHMYDQSKSILLLFAEFENLPFLMYYSGGGGGGSFEMVSVDISQWRCHGNPFVKEHFGLFLSQIVFISGFFRSNSKSSPQNRPMCKISSKLAKGKGSRILTSHDRENDLMTSYRVIVMTSSKFLMLSRDFVPEYHHAKFGGDWTTNKGETCLPTYSLPK